MVFGNSAPEVREIRVIAKFEDYAKQGRKLGIPWVQNVCDACKNPAARHVLKLPDDATDGDILNQLSKYPEIQRLLKKCGCDLPSALQAESHLRHLARSPAKSAWEKEAEHPTGKLDKLKQKDYCSKYGLLFVVGFLLWMSLFVLGIALWMYVTDTHFEFFSGWKWWAYPHGFFGAGILFVLAVSVGIIFKSLQYKGCRDRCCIWCCCCCVCCKCCRRRRAKAKRRIARGSSFASSSSGSTWDLSPGSSPRSPTSPKSRDSAKSGFSEKSKTSKTSDFGKSKSVGRLASLTRSATSMFRSKKTDPDDLSEKDKEEIREYLDLPDGYDLEKIAPAPEDIYSITATNKLEKMKSWARGEESVDEDSPTQLSLESLTLPQLALPDLEVGDRDMYTPRTERHIALLEPCLKHYDYSTAEIATLIKRLDYSDVELQIVMAAIIQDGGEMKEREVAFKMKLEAHENSASNVPPVVQTECQACGEPYPRGAKFCGECGATRHVLEEVPDYPHPHDGVKPIYIGGSFAALWHDPRYSYAERFASSAAKAAAEAAKSAASVNTGPVTDAMKKDAQNLLKMMVVDQPHDGLLADAMRPHMTKFCERTMKNSATKWPDWHPESKKSKEEKDELQRVIDGKKLRRAMRKPPDSDAPASRKPARKIPPNPPKPTSVTEVMQGEMGSTFRSAASMSSERFALESLPERCVGLAHPSTFTEKERLHRFDVFSGGNSRTDWSADIDLEQQVEEEPPSPELNRRGSNVGFDDDDDDDSPGIQRRGSIGRRGSFVRRGSNVGLGDDEDSSISPRSPGLKRRDSNVGMAEDGESSPRSPGLKRRGSNVGIVDNDESSPRSPGPSPGLKKRSSTIIGIGGEDETSPRSPGPSPGLKKRSSTIVGIVDDTGTSPNDELRATADPS